MFQAETNSPPSPPIHTILPSGIAVIGIDSWIERFTKIFQNLQPDGSVAGNHSSICNRMDKKSTHSFIPAGKDYVPPLFKRNAIKLKQAVSRIKDHARSIDGDIARLSEFKLLLTPRGVKVAKAKK